MTISAFGVEDNRISKADRSDRQVVGRRTAEGAAIGAGAGGASLAGGGAYVVRAHKKTANRYEDVHRTGSTATERVDALHDKHRHLKEAQRFRRLTPRASRNAAIIGGVLGAGTGAISGAVHHLRNRRRN